MYILFVMSIFVCFFSYSLYRKNFLMMLLVLEMTVLLTMIIILIQYMFIIHSVYLLILFLSMSVCEGALGISLLVSMMRCHGGDYVYLFNVLW